MPGWDEILREIDGDELAEQNVSPLDFTRRKYLKSLSDLTGRNVIAYYSAWLSKPNTVNSDINDGDMIGFMNALKGMDTSRGLDLVLHTPGGAPTAAESIVKYLRKKFNCDIRVMVPHLAMSAGTMIACAGKEVIMGKQSSLGPIDPQFNGIPAFCIKQEFNEAQQALENGNDFLYWKILLEKYPVAFLNTVLDAIDLSEELVREWLGTCMFDKKEHSSMIDSIVEKLNEHENSKSHSRHFDVDTCIAFGLKVKLLEEDGELQDALLSVHHAFSHTLSIPSVVKIIENHNGKAYICHTEQRMG